MNINLNGVVMARKAESWTEESIPMLRNATTLEAIKDLPAYPAEAFPTKDFSGPRPRFHIADLPTGERFLVNTEGYDYARYVTRLPPEPAAKEPGSCEVHGCILAAGHFPDQPHQFDLRLSLAKCKKTEAILQVADRLDECAQLLRAFAEDFK